MLYCCQFLVIEVYDLSVGASERVFLLPQILRIYLNLVFLRAFQGRIGLDVNYKFNKQLPLFQTFPHYDAFLVQHYYVREYRKVEIVEYFLNHSRVIGYDFVHIDQKGARPAVGC